MPYLFFPLKFIEEDVQQQKDNRFTPPIVGVIGEVYKGKLQRIVTKRHSQSVCFTFISALGNAKLCHFGKNDNIPESRFLGYKTHLN